MQRKASPNHNFTYNNEIKNVVTPFAFSVAEELLGQPLASPRRRAVAILLDLLVIAVLTLISSTYLSIAVFLIAARTYYSIRHEEGSTGVRISLAVAMLIALLTIGWQLLWTQGVTVGDTEVSAGAKAAEVALSTDSSFTEWLKEYLDDFGLSFGWAALYFTVLTAWWNGQTLGKKIMAIKVVRIDGKKIEGELMSVEEEEGEFMGLVLKTREKIRIEGRKAREWVDEEHQFKADDLANS